MIKISITTEHYVNTRLGAVARAPLKQLTTNDKSSSHWRDTHSAHNTALDTISHVNNTLNSRSPDAVLEDYLPTREPYIQTTEGGFEPTQNRVNWAVNLELKYKVDALLAEWINVTQQESNDDVQSCAFMTCNNVLFTTCTHGLSSTNTRTHTNTHTHADTLALHQASCFCRCTY